MTSPQKPDKFNARVIVVEQVYHQVNSRQPTMVDSRWAQALKSSEAMRSVLVPLSEESKLLVDLLDWDPSLPMGMIALSNEEGKNRQRQPSSTEKADEALKVVEYGILTDSLWTPFGIIPPGRSCRFEGISPERVGVRARKGPLRCLITVVPGL